MYVVTSQFEVANGMEEKVRQAFRDRPHLVDNADGFIRMDVVSPEDNERAFMLITCWRDKRAYEVWHKGHAYAEAHGGIPKGLKLVQGRTVITGYVHIAS